MRVGSDVPLAVTAFVLVLGSGRANAATDADVFAIIREGFFIRATQPVPALGPIGLIVLGVSMAGGGLLRRGWSIQHR